MNVNDRKLKRKRNVLLHISVIEEIATQLKQLAKKWGRTVTELAREAFAKLLKEYKES